MLPHHSEHAAFQPPVPRASRRIGLDRISLRGLVGGLIAVALGATLVRPVEGWITLGDGIVLGAVFVGALIAGSAADRMSARRLANASERGWMTVYVTTQGPSTPEITKTRPPSSPCPNPERRSIPRLARGRRRRQPSLSSVR
jgi:hypothetical protein